MLNGVGAFVARGALPTLFDLVEEIDVGDREGSVAKLGLLGAGTFFVGCGAVSDSFFLLALGVIIALERTFSLFEVTVLDGVDPLRVGDRCLRVPIVNGVGGKR